MDWALDLTEAERQDFALVLLLRHDMGGSWDAARPILAADVPRAEEVLGRVLHSRDFTPSTPIAADVQAEIYLWLRQNFPPESDPQFEDAHIVGARERIGQWRDAILRDLEVEGTAAAVDALRTIHEALPEERWLTRVIAAARSNVRRNTWTPTPIGELLLLENDADATIVNDLTSLGTAVDAAMGRLQRRLTGATPESHLLWDSHSGRPKTEDAISDYLSVRLNQELIERRVIVNREVQIRRNRPSGVGERTDLLIDAFSLSAHHAARLSLPVEVKGAWNSELLTALREQLVHRYMRDVGSDQGMYVVVWPDDTSWTDDTDYRRAKLRALDRKAVRDALAEEARRLEETGLSVAVRHLDISYRRAQDDR